MTYVNIAIYLKPIFICYIIAGTLNHKKIENMLTHCQIGEYNLLKLFFLDISKREKNRKRIQ